MPNDNPPKRIRTRGVRMGVRMNSGAYNSRTARIPLPPDKLVPDFEELGRHAFNEEHLRALTRRLEAPNWPKGALNIYGLEGLITALLILPLAIRPTVWLPLIWNESGWKIPAALQGDDEFQQFVELLGGFMRAIDTDLSATPPRSVSTVESLATQHRPNTLHPQRDWAQGFGLAVSQSNYLTMPLDTTTESALYAIAIHAQPRSTNAERVNYGSDRTFRKAILTLASMRTSRGPLGEL